MCAVLSKSPIYPTLAQNRVWRVTKQRPALLPPSCATLRLDTSSSTHYAAICSPIEKLLKPLRTFENMIFDILISLVVQLMN